LLCNESAVAGGLQADGEKNYFAWLSYGSNSPLDSVDPSAAYTLVDGTPVFEKADLENCDYGVACLAHPIDLDAKGVTRTNEPVWTGWGSDTTGVFNNQPGGANCQGWASNSATNVIKLSHHRHPFRLG
jgi:hypothetical protein